MGKGAEEESVPARSINEYTAYSILPSTAVFITIDPVDSWRRKRFLLVQLRELLLSAT